MLHLLFAAELALGNAPVGGERQLSGPQLAHFVAAIDPHEVVPWGKIGQLEAQRGGIFTLRQRLNAFIGYPQ